MRQFQKAPRKNKQAPRIEQAVADLLERDLPRAGTAVTWNRRTKTLRLTITVNPKPRDN
jgi:hypothetical protein